MFFPIYDELGLVPGLSRLLSAPRRLNMEPEPKPSRHVTNFCLVIKANSPLHPPFQGFRRRSCWKVVEGKSDPSTTGKLVRRGGVTVARSAEAKKNAGAGLTHSAGSQSQREPRQGTIRRVQELAT